MTWKPIIVKDVHRKEEGVIQCPWQMGVGMCNATVDLCMSIIIVLYIGAYYKV